MTGGEDLVDLECPKRMQFGPCGGVKPDGQRLTEIGKMIDDGKLRPFVQEVLPLEHAKKALELSRSRHVGGKIVLSI